MSDANDEPRSDDAPAPVTKEESAPLPSASQELARVDLDPEETPLDPGLQERVAEASVSRVEATTRLEEARAAQAAAQARTAEAESKKAEAEVKIAETAAGQARDDRKLREKVAKWVFVAALVQVGIADVVFIVYAVLHGPEPGTMNAWLGATVVQVLAVAIVIARSLFPSK